MKIFINDRCMSRRRFLQVSAGMAGLAALAACAPPAPSGDTPAASEESSSASEPAMESVVLSIGLTWGATFQPVQAEFNDNFMEEHPHIELDVVYNTWADHNNVVPTWAAASQLPDLIYVHGSRGFPWAFEGITVPLDEYANNDEEFNIEGVWEEALRLYRFQGEQHGIPYDHGPMLVGYNKDIFDAAGMNYPGEGWTMDDLRQCALDLTTMEGDTPQWGYSGSCPSLSSTSTPSTLGGWGALLLNDDENQLMVDTAEAREAIQFWYDIIHEDKSAPTPAESQAFEQSPFLSGRVGMENVPSWSTPNLTAYAEFAWDVAPWPIGPVAQVTGSFGSGFSITKDSTVPDAGWAYLRKYLSKEGMEFMWGSSGRGSPARKAAYQSWMDSENAPEHAQFYLEALENYAITARPYNTLGAAELNDLCNREVALLKSGEKDVDTVLDTIISEGQPILDEAWERLQAAR